jgi:hypothetical protein
MTAAPYATPGHTSETAREPPEQHWGAIAKQIGTNETMNEVAPTREELDTKLFGRAYPAAADSVFYYRFTPEYELTFPEVSEMRSA